MEEKPENQTPQTQNDPALPLQRAIQSGGSWFYWIAALTLINTITAQLKVSGQFVVGAFFTQLFDYFATIAKSPGAKTMMIGMSLIVIAIYAIMGVYSVRKQTWAFVVGLILYGLDTLLMIGMVFLSKEGLGSVLFSILFHIFALLGIINGLRACVAISKLPAAVPAPQPSAAE